MQDVYGKGGNVYEIWIPVESFELRAAPLFSAAEKGVRLPGMNLDFSGLDREEEEGGGEGEGEGEGGAGGG